MTSGEVYACRVGAIDLRVDDKEIILINTLVVHGKPLEFDLLVGIDTRHLEGCPFHRQVRCGYSGKNWMCAVLCNDEPDFHRIQLLTKQMDSIMEMGGR